MVNIVIVLMVGLPLGLDLVQQKAQLFWLATQSVSLGQASLPDDDVYDANDVFDVFDFIMLMMIAPSPEELHFDFDASLSRYPGFHPDACKTRI